MNFAKTDNEHELEELKTLVAQGNESAFRKLFNLFFTQLIKFATTLVKSKDAATDIVDEVFIRLWKNKTGIISIDNLKAYLYRAVKNASLNYISRKTQNDLFESLDDFYIQLTDEYSPEQQMVSREIAVSINKAVNSLPPKCKMVFMLVREDGLKYKEVADILNISIKTVDAQMVIAINRIRESVKELLPMPRSQKKSQKN
jgi:RNA polymerase sigma-70 factor (ECF subfamily)